MRDFRNILAWGKAHKFVLAIYSLTKEFPKSEIYGITNQLRRATVSIPNNISEGCGRKSKKELFNFLNISMGSATEVEYLLILCRDLEFISDEDYKINNDNLIEVRKMLNVYMQKIEDDINGKNSDKN